MSEIALAKPIEVVGAKPWLPWPLAAWSWWTAPAPAERLAAVRIGVAVCLLADIAVNYAPHALDFFGKDGLGDPLVFDWRFQPPRASWSLLRGVGDAATVWLSLAVWAAMTLWILGNAAARLLLIRANPPRDDRTGIALAVWTAALAVYCAGLWSRAIVANEELGDIAWLVPLIGVSLAPLFGVFEMAQRLRDPGHRIGWRSLLIAWLAAALLLALGIWLSQRGKIDPAAPWVRLLKPWQDDPALVVAAMIAWLGAAFLLLVGLGTRVSAAAAWLISMSFANANPHLDNAGDTIRLILLFYLMLSPCGAVWSVDALFRKRSGPVYVHPWPLRLIFVQLICIYFMNGLYKLCGSAWMDGSSLHYVLGDLTLSRFSQVQLPIPFWLLQMMTWTVVTWELSFPLLVLWTWPRRLALAFGVLFHLGIFATMELGPFVPYALCMYLPLLSWERLRRRAAA